MSARLRGALSALAVAVLVLTGITLTATPAEAAQITIQGTIRQNGSPVPGAEVWLWSSSGAQYVYSAQITADGSGHYSVSALPDTLTYRISVPGGNGYAETWYGDQAFHWNATNISGSTTANVNRIQGGTVALSVFGGTDKFTMQGATLRLCHFEADETFCVNAPGLSDPSGHLTATGIAPGLWRAEIGRSSYPSEYYNDWALDADGPVDLIQVTAGTTVSIGAWLLNEVEPSHTYFQDVPASSTFYDAIDYVARQGISTGTPVYLERPVYNPSAAVSRQAMAVFLFRMSQETFVPPGTPHFADVPLESSFYQAIEWMYAKGLSTGTPQPSGLPLFKPAEAVSRQAMAAFLFRFDGSSATPPATQSFADVPPASPFYQAIEWMYAADISTGTPNPPGKPLYKPTDPVSRQAMALFLQRYGAT